MLIQITNKNTKKNSYPYNATKFKTLNLNAPVVFFTGENGSGKSTVLKLISSLTDSISISKYDYKDMDDTGYAVAWDLKLKKGLYFQSEDFFSFLNWLEEEEIVNQEMLEDAKARHNGTVSAGKLLETALHTTNVKTMNHMVKEFKDVSHGEGYIGYFASKLRPNTLYLLDEPETPLSFQNQLALMALIDEYVKLGSQFIICTHSPILLAYPNSLIYLFGDDVHEVEYEDHPIRNNYKSFLNDHKRYLYHLLDEE